MNNKGFAITSVLYGLLAMFLLIVVGTLGILANHKRLMDEVIDGSEGIEGAREIAKLNVISVDDTYFNTHTTTTERALYVYTYLDHGVEKVCKRYYDLGVKIDKLDFENNSNCIS